MGKGKLIWAGLVALVAVPVVAQKDSAVPPPIAKPAAPPIIAPSAPETKTPEPTKAASAAQAMIDGALKKINKDIKRDTNIWQFELAKHQVIVITDPVAERMRIMVPIADAKALDPAMLTRLMQANFDSALDARYAVAQEVLWGVFIHPLTSLDEKGFVSGLAQTLAVVDNFGTSYSSGAVVFGGGDSPRLQAEQLLELLRQKSEADKKNVI